MSRGIMAQLFGPPPPTPQEMAAGWKKQLQLEGRNIDKQVRNIQREETKTKLLAKQAAKKGDVPSVKVLAREMLRARQTVKRMVTTKAQMNSVALQLNLMMSQVAVAGALQKSTTIVRSLNALCRAPEIAMIMQQMSAEMTKAGLLEEMIDGAFDDALEDGIDEGELDREVNAVVKEIMDKQLRGTESVTDALPEVAEPEPEVEEPVEEEGDAELARKLAALRGAAAAAS